MGMCWACHVLMMDLYPVVPFACQVQHGFHVRFMLSLHTAVTVLNQHPRFRKRPRAKLGLSVCASFAALRIAHVQQF
jgi:hypothetical protein